jgi:hypothetical protein
VKADKSRREQLVTQVVLAGRSEGVVKKEGIADGSIDDTVEDVRKEFTLWCLLAFVILAQPG